MQPSILQFDQKVADRIFQQNQNSLILFLKNSSSVQNLTSLFHSVSGYLKNRILLTTAEMNSSMGRVLADHLGID
jgi:hypothetical protein